MQQFRGEHGTSVLPQHGAISRFCELQLQVESTAGFREVPLNHEVGAKSAPRGVKVQFASCQGRRRETRHDGPELDARQRCHQIVGDDPCQRRRWCVRRQRRTQRQHCQVWEQRRRPRKTHAGSCRQQAKGAYWLFDVLEIALAKVNDIRVDLSDELFSHLHRDHDFARSGPGSQSGCQVHADAVHVQTIDDDLSAVNSDTEADICIRLPRLVACLGAP